MSPAGTIEFTRKHPRIRIELRAEFVISDCEKESSQRESAVIKILGGGGVMLISPEPLSEGTLVDMKVYFECAEMTFKAEVVWTELQLERNQKEFRCGLKFHAIADDDLLYIQHVVHRQLRTDPGSAA